MTRILLISGMLVALIACFGRRVSHRLLRRGFH